MFVNQSALRVNKKTSNASIWTFFYCELSNEMKINKIKYSYDTHIVICWEKTGKSKYILNENNLEINHNNNCSDIFIKIKAK